MARADLRRRRASLALLAVLVALVTTAVLGTTAGARRSASAVDRLLEGTAARDARVGVFGRDIPDELRERILAIDGVRDVGIASSTLAGVETDFDALIVVSPDNSIFERIDRPVVLEGRMPDVDDPHELVLNELAAAQLGVHTGDRIEVPTFAAGDTEVLTSGGDWPGFRGPVADFEVVGVVRLPDDLVGSSKDSTPMLVATPAFLEQSRSEVAWLGTLASVTLDDQTAVEELRALADDYSAEGVESWAGTIDDDWGSGVRDAIDVIVVALTAAAVVAAIAGLMAVGQATSRQMARRREEVSVGWVLGFTRHQNALAIALPAAISVMLGAALGAMGAFAVSGWFPLAVARRAEIDPGPAVDLPVLAGGFVAVTLFGSAWTYFIARRVTRRSPAGRPTVSGLGRWVGKRARPPVRVGVDRALGTGVRQQRVTGRVAIAGAAMGAGGVVAVLVLAASLQTALDRPEWWGWTWTAKPELLDPSRADEIVEALADEESVAAAGILERGSVEVESRRITATALRTTHGELALSLAEGRLPVSDAEVAVGAETLDDLGVDIGGLVRARTLGGDTGALRVVGRVAVPLTDNLVPGTGMVVTPERLATLAPEVERELVLRYADGADVTGLEQRLLDEYQLDSSGAYARPHPPSRLSNLDEAVELLPALAAFFVVLAALALLHGLVISTREHRSEFGVLAALGLRRAQNRSVVGWQGIATVALGVVAGVPAGVLVGRAVWNLLVRNVGMLDMPTVPWLAVALTAIAAIVIAAALSWSVGRFFVRGRPAELLRAE
jgi:hypothetical protein